MVAGFALFHGHAHGAEMQLGQAGLTYGAGFVLSTALLLGSGIAGGLFLAEVARRSWLRVAGGAIVAGGLALAFGWI
jgi:urease accessory protein